MEYKFSFEKALNECKKSPDFLMQLKSGNYLYVESFFCLNQPKYVNWDKTIATLTDYARGHKSECCLPVSTRTVCEKVCEIGSSIAIEDDFFEIAIPYKADMAFHRPKRRGIPWFLFPHRPKPKPKPKVEVSESENEAKIEVNDLENVPEQAESFKAEVCDMDTIIKALPRDFPGALDKLIKWRGVKEEDLAESSNLSEKTIQRLRRHETDEIKLETVIQLCIGLHLHPILSNYLLSAAGKTLRTSKLHIAYGLLLNSCYLYSVEFCNTLLTEMGFSSLGRKRDTVK